MHEQFLTWCVFNGCFDPDLDFGLWLLGALGLLVGSCRWRKPPTLMLTQSAGGGVKSEGIVLLPRAGGKRERVCVYVLVHQSRFDAQTWRQEQYVRYMYNGVSKRE